MSTKTSESDFLHRRPSNTTESVLLAFCAVSLTAYLCFSVAVRAFINELIRLADKFLG